MTISVENDDLPGGAAHGIVVVHSGMAEGIVFRGLPQKYPDFASKLLVTFGGLFFW
jgi:hypothetical protein